MREKNTRVLAAASEFTRGWAYGGNNVNDGMSAVGDADKNVGEV